MLNTSPNWGMKLPKVRDSPASRSFWQKSAPYLQPELDSSLCHCLPPSLHEPLWRDHLHLLHPLLLILKLPLGTPKTVPFHNKKAQYCSLSLHGQGFCLTLVASADLTLVYLHFSGIRSTKWRLYLHVIQQALNKGWFLCAVPQLTRPQVLLSTLAVEQQVPAQLAVQKSSGPSPQNCFSSQSDCCSFRAGLWTEFHLQQLLFIYPGQQKAWASSVSNVSLLLSWANLVCALHSLLQVTKRDVSQNSPKVDLGLHQLPTASRQSTAQLTVSLWALPPSW